MKGGAVKGRCGHIVGIFQAAAFRRVAERLSTPLAPAEAAVWRHASRERDGRLRTRRVRGIQLAPCCTPASEGRVWEVVSLSIQMYLYRQTRSALRPLHPSSL